MGDREEGQRRYNQSLELREQIADEQPDFWPAQNDLGLSYNQLGAMLYPQGGNAAGARKLHQKALPIFKKRASADPSDFENKHILAETLYYEATCALHLGKKDEAAAGYHECLKICKELAKEPKAKQSQTLLMLALARCGDHGGAAKIAAKLVAASPKDAGLYIQAACGYALAAGAAGVDAGGKAAIHEAGPRMPARGQGARLGRRRDPRDRYRPRADPQRKRISRRWSTSCGNTSKNGRDAGA